MIMMFTHGDLDDCVNVIDVWMDEDPLAQEEELELFVATTCQN
jgi:hypothetical protein